MYFRFWGHFEKKSLELSDEWYLNTLVLSEKKSSEKTPRYLD